MPDVCIVIAVAALCCLGQAGTPVLAETDLRSKLPSARFWEVVELDVGRIPVMREAHESEVAILACDETCVPIPWQLDERDAHGQVILDNGPEADIDHPPGLLDGNDSLVFMAADAGRRVAGGENSPLLLRAAVAAVEVEVRDPRTARRAWVYIIRFSAPAPRSSKSYVRYDPTTDRVEGKRVALGFAQGTPRFLGLVQDDGSQTDNLLDRMKIRATARFLWGLFAVTRDEDDVLTRPVAWRQGPIRVIRRQHLWVRLAFGLRTPIFRSETYVYRDFAEMPVRLRLNFAPRLLFTDVTVRAALDFYDLRGWEVETPGRHRVPHAQRITGQMLAEKTALAYQPGEWFALRGPQVTFVQAISVSPSLRTVQRRLFYREGWEIDDPPESRLGEMPGIGYTLSHWEQVNSGRHWLVSRSYALPAEEDMQQFVATLRQPLRTEVRALPVASRQ